MHKSFFKIILVLILSFFSISVVRATTVCWDGKNLACDSQMTAGHRKLKCKTKFYRNEGRHAVLAAGGSVEAIEKVVHYWLSCTAPLSEAKLDIEINHMSPMATFALLVISDDGKALAYEDDLKSPITVEAPYAFGTGGDFALAAMALGASAAEAVKVAEELDIYTGGTVHVIKAPQPETLKADSKKKS